MAWPTMYAVKIRKSSSSGAMKTYPHLLLRAIAPER